MILLPDIGISEYQFYSGKPAQLDYKQIYSYQTLHDACRVLVNKLSGLTSNRSFDSYAINRVAEELQKAIEQYCYYLRVDIGYGELDIVFNASQASNYYSTSFDEPYFGYDRFKSERMINLNIRESLVQKLEQTPEWKEIIAHLTKICTEYGLASFKKLGHSVDENYSCKNCPANFALINDGYIYGQIVSPSKMRYVVSSAETINHYPNHENLKNFDDVKLVLCPRLANLL